MSTLPAFTKDITGMTNGGAYWNEDDFRLNIETTSSDMFRLWVEDSSGALILEQEFTDVQADRLRDLVGSSEEADDEGLGLSRELHWRLSDIDYHEVDLNMSVLEEIREWLDAIFDAQDKDD